MITTTIRDVVGQYVIFNDGRMSLIPNYLLVKKQNKDSWSISSRGPDGRTQDLTIQRTFDKPVVDSLIKKSTDRPKK